MEYKKNRTITSAETDDIIAPEINLTGMVVANATVSCRIEGEVELFSLTLIPTIRY